MADPYTYREFSIAPATAAPPPAKSADSGQPQARVIALASGEVGAGKSSLCVNLSFALARQGRRVCVFDAAANRSNASRLLGLSPEITLQDLLQQDRSVDELLTTGPGNIQLLPAAAGIGQFIHLGAEQQRRLLAALKMLEQRFDYLFIDTATGIDETLIQFLLAAPYTILTITPEPTSLTNTFSLLKRLKRYYFNHPLYVIVNRVSSLPEAHDAFKQLKQTAANSLQLEIRYLGYALSDQELPQSLRDQQPILLQQPQAMFSQCLTALSNRLRQLLDQEPPADHNFSGFFEELGLPREQGASGDPPLAVTGVDVDRRVVGERLDTAADEQKPAPISTPMDERAALLAATYYAHLLGSKETMSD